MNGMARAKLADIMDAVDFVSSGPRGEHEAYVCRETGKTYWHSDLLDYGDELPDDIDDAERYIEIPHRNDLDLGKRLVLRFADELLPRDADRVREMFSRRGAYARFIDLLRHRRMLERWNEYEKSAQHAAVKQWCADNGMELDDG